ncbi:hypothetical protein DEU56DRAFT_820656 [Suillus clintonianus]|uniref:uncharacterized protein n=1 Tax=Suillus clintonianus TaxID=1904413 RepID=UPI001B882EC4|nr:uncharacterized protein DEU56DRAFT_820656 [Suillus clintonianus]KAG2127211.1 hypothetical protein DEU56DRAFT_820656 [Suillus clintonianus]
MLKFCIWLLLGLASRPRPDALSHNCAMHHPFPIQVLTFSSAGSFVCTLRQVLVCLSTLFRLHPFSSHCICLRQ